MAKRNSSFSSKELKSFKKDELIRLVLESQDLVKAQTNAGLASTTGPKGRLPRTPNKSSELPLMSTEFFQAELVAKVKSAVLEAVSDLKSELRLEYRALLNDAEAKFSSELESLRQENKALQASLNRQIMDFEKEVLRDRQEFVMRKDNLMIFGLKESAATELSDCKKDDLRALELLSSSLGVRSFEIQDCIRLGRRGDRPRPLKIRCRHPQQRIELLRSANKIPRIDANLGFRRVFIKPDLSPKEQLADKLLRDELKSRRLAGEHVTILGGRIVSDPKRLIEEN